jgi:hypothetical protein
MCNAGEKNLFTNLFKKLPMILLILLIPVFWVVVSWDRKSLREIERKYPKAYKTHYKK